MSKSPRLLRKYFTRAPVGTDLRRQLCRSAEQQAFSAQL
jgi:hypothetical protein